MWATYDKSGCWAEPAPGSLGPDAAQALFLDFSFTEMLYSIIF
jgi:hypothetical protein